MPEGDEGEGEQDVAEPVGPSSERDVKVPDGPAVEGAVPGLPKPGQSEVVAHAPRHVLRQLDAIGQRPEPEKAPDYQKLQPDLQSNRESASFTHGHCTAWRGGAGAVASADQLEQDERKEGEVERSEGGGGRMGEVLGDREGWDQAAEKLHQPDAASELQTVQ